MLFSVHKAFQTNAKKLLVPQFSRKMEPLPYNSEYSNISN